MLVSPIVMAKSPKRQPPTTEVETGALDVVSDVLGLLRLRGEVLCWSELSAPWGLSFAPDDALFFHIVERGSCLLQVASSDEPLRVSSGDLIVLPAGCGHRLVDSSSARAVPVMSLVDPGAPLPGHLVYGGGGAETRILCGRFRTDQPLRAPKLPGLPAVFHVRGTGGKQLEWLELAVRLLTTEAQSSAPGQHVALSRLVDFLLVQTIRYWLALRSDPSFGWLGALRDPRIGEALRLMHASPGRRWSVDGLAAEVGMSRSSFGQTFVDLVGEAPAKYLTRWRVHLGARLLQTPGATVAQIADRVGYESAAAFSRVFKRHMQMAPAAFRASAEAHPVTGQSQLLHG
jgi:AraC-like DNA-binding protein